ncbi:glucose-1-phosphate thymidylyltransferase [Halobacteriales archaeon QS_8_69_26]|nr:MAG: glucose-1-phosphate thymidylyltransferase [Halobacteriales archaeon QS_8_69_26]
MQTVVLAAGRGAGMRPLTDRRPKPMLPVGDRPLLAHVLDAAVGAGAERFVVVVGFEADAIRDHFGDEYRGVAIDYAVQQRRRATADAVLSAREHLEPAPFVVLNGDTLYDPADLADLYAGSAAVAGFRVEDPAGHDVLRTDGDLVTGVVGAPEDPASDLVDAGAYAFPAGALEGVAAQEAERGERDLTDVLSRVCRENDVRAVRVGRWRTVDRPWELLSANEAVLSDLDRSIRGRRNVDGDADLRGNVVVAEDAVVERGAVVEGPVLVRAGAEVGPNAYVRGPTLLGRDVRVGHATEVHASVLMSGSTVDRLSYVGHSVVGRNADFGTGTVVDDEGRDGEAVEVAVNNTLVSTGRERFGIVCGDDVSTGVHTSVDAGVKLSSGTGTASGEVVTGDR